MFLASLLLIMGRLGAWSRSILPVSAASFAYQVPATGRDYGWGQLSQVLGPTQDDGQNKWLTWSTKCELGFDAAKLFPAGSQINLSRYCATVRAAHLEGALRSAERSQQEPNAIRHLASVFYNDKAAEHIIQSGLNLPNDGSSAAPQAESGNASTISRFDDDSIIVKATWEIVSKDKGAWPLRIYDPEAVQIDKSNPDGTPSSLLQVENWTTKIYLNQSDKNPCPETTPGLRDIEPGVTLSINCFVNQYVPNPPPLGIQHIASRGNAGKYPYYLVLVGLHVAHKESGRWNWTTFWWTNRPHYFDNTYFSGNRPSDLPPQYIRFVMNTTAAGEAVVFNPYQEGPEGRGAASSNCQVCHSLAAYKKDQAQIPAGLGLSAAGLPAGYWDDAIATDSIWSIATARNTAPGPFGQNLLLARLKRLITR